MTSAGFAAYQSSVTQIRVRQLSLTSTCCADALDQGSFRWCVTQPRAIIIRVWVATKGGNGPGGAAARRDAADRRRTAIQARISNADLTGQRSVDDAVRGGEGLPAAWASIAVVHYM